MTPKQQAIRKREIVINVQFGGFGLSHKAMMLYAKLKGFKLYPFVEEDLHSLKNRKFVPYNAQKNADAWVIHYSKKPLKNGKYDDNSYFSDDDIPRDDPILVKVVKQLGIESYGDHATLQIVKIPFDVEWEIDEYDGNESIEEKHRSWR